MALLDAVRTRLLAASSLESAAVFTSRRALVPDVSTPVLTLTATSGPGDALRTHNGGVLRESVVQVSVRALSAADAIETAETARAALDVAGLTVGSVRFLWMRPASELMELPLDSAGRALVAFKLQARYADAS